MINLGTRGRILVLVVLSAIPALGLTVYNALEQRASAKARAGEDLQRYARLAAETQEQTLEGMRHLLFALSGAVPALLKDRDGCNDYFRRMMQASGGLYHSMGVQLPEGKMFCNGAPWKKIVDVNDRYYFRAAADYKKFAVGEYQIGRITRLQGINFGHPVLNESGSLVAVVFAGLDLKRFNELAKKTPHPEGSVVTVFDRHGTVLAQQPAFTERIGQKSPYLRVNRAIFSARSGVFETTDVNGVPRLYAFESAGENPDGGVPLRIMVGIPRHVIFAEVNRNFIRTVVGLAIATILLLIGAWYGAEELVLRNLRKLLDVARLVHSGDLTARTRLPAGREELSQLGSAFDEMAQALQDRDARLQQALRESHELAITDPLTGLYNRRYLWDMLGRELLKAGRARKPVTAILMDIDHFKRFNDTWGHEAGDLVLKRVSDVIREHVRGSDIACRYGGEELTVILPEATLEIGVERAETIRRDIAALRLELGGQALGNVTTSFGVAAYPEHAGDAEALLRAADAALYEAKRTGRNRVVACSASTALLGAA